MITIDGAQGEGGGQILRTALTLSMLTGKPFRIDNIRAGRAKPGLMRQHLAAVRAAASICAARITGDEPGSRQLRFEPGAVRAGAYEFAINSAGSTALVLQTVMMPLALSGARSRLVLKGGTHNTHAPPFEFVDRALLPLLRTIGYDIDASLQRPGFYPAGGGEVHVEIAPAKSLQRLELVERGEPRRRMAEAILASLPFAIAQRELAALQAALGWDAEDMRPRMENDADGPGNVLVATLAFENVTEVFSGFGERGVAAETIARAVGDRVTAYATADVAVGPFLADQLLVPMALGRGGRFSTLEPTSHATTNMAVIGMFIDTAFDVAKVGDGRWMIGVSTNGRDNSAADVRGAAETA